MFLFILICYYLFLLLQKKNTQFWYLLHKKFVFKTLVYSKITFVVISEEGDKVCQNEGVYRVKMGRKHWSKTTGIEKLFLLFFFDLNHCAIVEGVSNTSPNLVTHEKDKRCMRFRDRKCWIFAIGQDRLVPTVAIDNPSFVVHVARLGSWEVTKFKMRRLSHYLSQIRLVVRSI